MRLHKFFLYTVFFTTLMVSSQNKKVSLEKTISFVESIDVKRHEAIKLYQEYEYKKAFAILKQCIKKSDSIKNDTLLGKSYITIGNIYSFLGKETEAIYSHRKAEVIFAKRKDYKRVGIIYNNIAFAYFKNSKNIDSIIWYYKKGLNIFKYLGDEYKIALTNANLGKIYALINELEKATLHLEIAIPLAKKQPNKKALSIAYLAYGEVQYKKNNLQKALEYLNLAQEIAEKVNNEPDLVLIYKLKSIVLKQIGGIGVAQNTLKKYNKYLKLTHKIEKSRLIQEASVKFEVKESKTKLEKEKLKNNVKEGELKKSNQIIFFISILFLISIIGSLLLFKNNILKKDNNKLLILKNEELKELQNQTELNVLKTQIQPHFFFNTLIILHTLILEKSEKSESVVIKLSELMQYSIYEAKKEKVSIWSEINSIQNYLELEGIYKKQENIPSIEINGNLDQIKIPPLLYFSFLENYFKSNNDRNKKIEISFSNIEDKYLLFSFKNNVDFSKQKKEITTELGIKSIKHRLNLLYKNNYLLITEKVNNIFSISLKIPV